MHNRLLTLGVLFGAIGLLQYHSIQFWQLFTEPRDRHRLVPRSRGYRAVVVVSASISAPGSSGSVRACYSLQGRSIRVSAPLVAELERTVNGDTARVALIGELQSEVRSAEQSLTVANDNATAAPKWQRASWIPAIDRAQTRAVAARGKLLELEFAQRPEATPVMTLRRRAVVLMQALTLVILQLAGILAITTLARERSRGSGFTSPNLSNQNLAPRRNLAPRSAKRRAEGWAEGWMKCSTIKELYEA